MKGPVLIVFQRTGGFTGLNLHATIDSHSLSAEDREELGRLLSEAALPEILQEPPATGSIADQFTYMISIRQGEERYVVHLDEKRVPPSVRPLLNFLTKQSKKKK